MKKESWIVFALVVSVMAVGSGVVWGFLAALQAMFPAGAEPGTLNTTQPPVPEIEHEPLVADLIDVRKEVDEGFERLGRRAAAPAAEVLGQAVEEAGKAASTAVEAIPNAVEKGVREAEEEAKKKEAQGRRPK